MSTIRVGFLLTLTLACLGQSARAQRLVKVKVEASELDKALLLPRLTKRGKGHGLKFEVMDSGYDYRVVFSTGQEVRSSFASATVYDAKGIELFAFKRAGRLTDNNAADVAAKEIIKRLIRWWHTSEGESEAPISWYKVKRPVAS